jgi:hypothetical protein
MLVWMMAIESRRALWDPGALSSLVHELDISEGVEGVIDREVCARIAFSLCHPGVVVGKSRLPRLVNLELRLCGDRFVAWRYTGDRQSGNKRRRKSIDRASTSLSVERCCHDPEDGSRTDDRWKVAPV